MLEITLNEKTESRLERGDFRVHGEGIMSTETFTKQSIREKHKRKIAEILQQGGSVEDLTNYIMSRIGDVISYERRKYERRQMREWSKHYEQRRTLQGG